MFVSFAVLLRILSNSTANLFQKRAGKVSSSVLTNMWVYAIMSIACIIPALFVDWRIYSLEFWVYVFIAGLLCTVGTVALIEALAVGELSVLAPINSYKSVIGLISAIFILGELPCLKDFICIILIVIGSYFVLDPEDFPFSLKTFFRRDVRLRIFALLCSGIEASFLKKIILLSSYKISLILWCFSGFICSLIIFGFKYKKFPIIQKNNRINCFVIALMLFIMQLTTNYVFSKIEVGAALALFQLSSLVSLYYGYKIFNEINMKRKFLGTVIMVMSAVCILIR